METKFELLLSWPIIVSSILIFLYWHFTKTFGHWKKKGVIFIKPIIIFGNLKERVLFKKSFHEFYLDLYQKFKGHRYAGIFEGRRPSLMILDPELIKCVMVGDFDHFVDRSTFQQKSPGYIQNMLINLKGNEWKQVRQLMTPAFTSGKLRHMELLVKECGEHLEEYFDENTNKEGKVLEIEMKDFIGRFTLDVIATSAFGVESNSIKHPKSELITMMSKFGDTPIYKRIALFFIILFVPMFAKYIPISFFNVSIMSYLNNFVLTVGNHRKTQNIKRNDFLQLMIENQHDDVDGKVLKLKEVEIDGDIKEKQLMSKDTVSAQSILFLIAGYETSSTLLSFTCYELAMNEDIQIKLRSHILEVLKRFNGECSYEALQEMHYLEMVLNESLRMHPPVARVDRHCTKPYTIPGSDVQISVGESINVPIMGLHYDPDYYLDPYKFDPERFSTEEKSKRSPYVFLPFGAGPRNCIGLRFALMSTKIAMVYILKKYKLTKSAKTKFEYNKQSMLLKPKDGLYLNIEPL